MSRYFNEYEDYDENSLEHHGVLGMKWGVRRYLNADGSLTNKGKKRYYEGSSDSKKRAKGYERMLNDIDEEKVLINSKSYKQAKKEYNKLEKLTDNILNKAKSEGMTVNSKDCIRWEDRGRTSMADVGLIAAGLPIGYMPIGDDMTPRKGTQYSVKLTKASSQIDKKNRIKAARKEIGWDGKYYKKNEHQS